MTEFKDLIGKIVTKIDKSGDYDKITFTLNTGEQYKMYHSQDCCESVFIDDICGDLNDLLLLPIIKASEDSNSDKLEGSEQYQDDSFTWTFYNIATNKGHVTIRWYGSSNGYYSESVNFVKVGSNEDQF